MNEIRYLLDEIEKRPDCKINSPAGLPVVADAHVLPSDLREFYELCGGLSLYENADYCTFIISPDKLVPANPVIGGYSYFEDDDISHSWYIIAHDGNGDYLTIDLHSSRLGKCYDSFHDIHALPGDCAIIAMSFTDLLRRLIANEGQYWYWLEKDFAEFGDAYD